MPFRIHIDPFLRQIHTTAYGCFTGDDLREYYRTLRSHPDFRPDMDECFDLSEATEYHVSADDLRAFSLTTAPYTSQGVGVRVALLAPSDLAFGMARMYELLQTTTTNQLRVVRTRAEADAWLAGDASAAAVGNR